MAEVEPVLVALEAAPGGDEAAKIDALKGLTVRRRRRRPPPPLAAATERRSRPLRPLVQALIDPSDESYEVQRAAADRVLNVLMQARRRGRVAPRAAMGGGAHCSRARPARRAVASGEGA
jgi:hypothetical protein